MENCYPISILQKKSSHPSTGIPKNFFWVNTTLNSLSHIYLTGTTISPTKFLLCLFTERHYPTNLYTMLFHTNRVIVIHLIKFFGCKVPMIAVSPSNHVLCQFSCSHHYYIEAKLSTVQFLFLPTPVLQPDGKTYFPIEVLTTVLTKIHVFWDVVLS